MDEGGPWREFLTLLMRDIARNNSLFQGKLHQQLPRPILLELSRKSFYYVGLCIAMTLVQGGPVPRILCHICCKVCKYRIRH